MAMATVASLFSRFQFLDTDNKGYLSRSELLELVKSNLNSLGEKIVDAILYPPLELDPHLSQMEYVDFEHFCGLVSIFQPFLRSSGGISSTSHLRLTFLFRMIKGKAESKVSSGSIVEILTLAIGDENNQQEIRAIADKAVIELTEDENEGISLLKFIQVCQRLNVDQHLNCTFA